jgi:hypothetical protein
MACVLLLETGSHAPLALSQAFGALVIALLIVTTVGWQWKLLGDPHRAADLLGHVAFLGPMFSLIARLYTTQEQPLALKDLLAKAFEWAVGLIGYIPVQLADVIRSPSIALLFLGVSMSLLLSRRWGIAALGCVLALSIAFATTRPGFGGHVWFLAGIGCMLTAIALQYDRPAERMFWQEVAKKLAGDKQCRGDIELKFRILTRLYLGGRTLGERKCLGVVSRALALEPTDERVRAITHRVVGQLVHEDDLATVRTESSGTVLALSSAVCVPLAKDIRDEHLDGFALAAILPKAVLLLAAMLLWIVMPFDVIPDAIPVVGILDDVSVSVLGVEALRPLVKGLRPAAADQDVFR